MPLPDIDEAMSRSAFNFVVLGPRKILIADKNPKSRAFYESQGIECVLTPVDELRKANGAVGCMSAILHREMSAY
jgi:arginine deiminase